MQILEVSQFLRRAVFLRQTIRYLTMNIIVEKSTNYDNRYNDENVSSEDEKLEVTFKISENTFSSSSRALTKQEQMTERTNQNPLH